MQVGGLIKLIRTSRGIPQKDLAAKTGITHNYLSLVEGSKKQPSIDFIYKIAHALGISAHSLIIAASDIPPELNLTDQDKYRRLKQNLLTLLLSNS